MELLERFLSSLRHFQSLRLLIQLSDTTKMVLYLSWELLIGMCLKSVASENN